MAKTTKKKRGRPTLYRPELCEEIVNFFDVEPVIFRDVTITYKDGSTKEISEEEAAPLLFLTDFAKHIGVNILTLQRWTKEYPDFCSAYKEAKRLQTQFIMTNAIRGNYSAAFSCFTLKNIAKWRDEEDENWKDATDIKHSGSIGNWTELHKSAVNGTS